MQGYNVLMIFTPGMDRLLMCKRRKEPYKGLFNLIGGKIEPDETGIDAAYRELLEEAGIARDAVTLHHVMDFTYYVQQCQVEMYAGRLKFEVEASGDENELFWTELDQNFFDRSRYAGEGNIGHMLEQVRLCKSLFELDS
ncbi:NUDIX domain-containing protein [Paenibacillus sp. SCIV0701]|uniref:NUDIX domain-containing protein n=2 Tax=Paenibacillus soyae TaxID=2969249 RepID=A0A9X2MVJ7_9BACL|nr:NUDIX domain-containing protein [Paenibacillus soyae]